MTVNSDDSTPTPDGPSQVDTTGWSAAWKRRLADADLGLSVPRNTPRGRSERRFLALWDLQHPIPFADLCAAVHLPNDGWTRRRYTMDLLRDLRRVGSLVYDRRERVWYRTDLGAQAADAAAEWVLGGLRDHSKELT